MPDHGQPAQAPPSFIRAQERVRDAGYKSMPAIQYLIRELSRQQRLGPDLGETLKTIAEMSDEEIHTLLAMGALAK
jgi:hypothetical protein